ncbi:AAA domain-containing protein [Cryomorphaceae bacterium 1068]|nr:AAA domain-containing protein [Cryomorphaceae bacterium 1068]
MIPQAKDFYQYFKGCYRLDYREFFVENVLSRKYPFKWFVNGEEELLTEILPIIPYNNKKVADLEKELALYQIEKTLFYGVFFVLGESRNPLIKDKRVCAPLFLFPATIETLDDEKYLSIDRDAFQLNRAVLELFDAADSQNSKDQFVSEISELLEESNPDFIRLQSIVNKHFFNVHTKELLMTPRVWSESSIKNHLKTTSYSEGNFKIVPAAGTVLVKKSESSLKVLDDLSGMAEGNKFNVGFQNLLSGKNERAPVNSSIYKSRLNTDQYQALQNAYRFENSVVVGPPGTGKSYTITNIVSDAVINEQSVLVVSKTKQAVEVLRSMLEDDFKLKKYLIHTTGRNHRVSLKAKIRRYMSGIVAPLYISLEYKKIQKWFTRLTELQIKFENLVSQELKLSDLSFNSELNLFEKWHRFYLNATVAGSTRIWDVFHEIEELTGKLEIAVSSYTKGKIQYNIRHFADLFRTDLSIFYDALDTNSFSQYKRTLAKVKHANILKVFPIWLANLSELNSVLPLQQELFDLVIIDEATQCDIASALPAIYRAKRVVIVGDPNQLRHYSFVSKASQREMRNKYNLPDDKIYDYRNRSILDLYLSKVSSQDQVSFLREHFRSTPSIIEFSNQQFYGGQLQVLKSTPRHTHNSQIRLVRTAGTRNDQGINRVEANEIVSRLKELMRDKEELQLVPSIGVISPFSAQARHINQLIRDNFEIEQIKKFDLFCGTPYNFQGSERDVVFLSFCVSDDSHPSAFIHLNKPEVMNVAITRARSYQYVVTSVDVNVLNTRTLLFQYLRFIDGFVHYNLENKSLDRFQKEVTAALVEKGIDGVRSGYPLAGSVLDLLISQNGKNVFIDLIGYPGSFKSAFSIERYNTLTRTGLICFPLHYSFWQKDQMGAIELIESLLHN